MKVWIYREWEPYAESPDDLDVFAFSSEEKAFKWAHLTGRRASDLEEVEVDEEWDPIYETKWPYYVELVHNRDPLIIRIKRVPADFEDRWHYQGTIIPSGELFHRVFCWAETDEEALKIAREVINNDTPDGTQE